MALQLNQYKLMKSLDTLEDIERDVLIDRYRNKKTFQSIAEKLGVSRVTVSSIEARAIRKLRHPIVLNEIKYISIENYRKALSKVMELEELTHKLNNKCGELEYIIKTSGIEISNIKDREVQSNFMAVQIEELGLSVRSYNCLKRHGINSLSELLNMTMDEVYEIRNLGNKSYKEVIDVVNNLGYQFKVREGWD